MDEPELPDLEDELARLFEQGVWSDGPDGSRVLHFPDDDTHLPVD